MQFLATTQGRVLNGAEYVILVLLATLASIGTTPIPSTSIVLVVMIASAVNVPITGMYAACGTSSSSVRCRVELQSERDLPRHSPCFLYPLVLTDSFFSMAIVWFLDRFRSSATFLVICTGRKLLRKCPRFKILRATWMKMMQMRWRRSKGSVILCEAMALAKRVSSSQ